MSTINVGHIVDWQPSHMVPPASPSGVIQKIGQRIWGMVQKKPQYITIDGQYIVPELYWQGHMRIGSGGGDSDLLVNVHEQDEDGFSELGRYCLDGKTIDLSVILGDLEISKIGIVDAMGEVWDNGILGVDKNKITFIKKPHFPNYTLDIGLDSGDRFTMKCEIVYTPSKSFHISNVKIKKLSFPWMKKSIAEGNEVQLLPEMITGRDLDIPSKQSFAVNLAGILENNISEVDTYYAGNQPILLIKGNKRLPQIQSLGKMLYIHSVLHGEFGSPTSGEYSITFRVAGDRYMLKFTVTENPKSPYKNEYYLSDFRIKAI